MTEAFEKLRREHMKQGGFGVEAMKAIKVCGQCGHPSPGAEAYCRECGCKLSDKTLYDIYKERHLVCSVCDTVMVSDSKYCPQCGNKTPTTARKKEVAK